jgi:outer membrane autotransporter protein
LGAGYGTFSNNGLTVNVLSGATVTGTGSLAQGIALGNQNTVTVEANAEVRGNTAGISLGEGSTVNNRGTVAGAFGIISTSPSLRVLNSGLIEGRLSHTSPGGSTLTLDNTGTITGRVEMIGGTVANSGTLSSGIRAGSQQPTPGVATISNFAGATSGPITTQLGTVLDLTNAGTVSGLLAVSLEDRGTIVNSGTFTGTGGTAIRFADLPAGQTNLLTLLPGSVINGNVVGGAGREVLRLGGAGNGAFNIGPIQSFEQYEKTGDSTWTLTGSNGQAVPIDIQQGRLVVNATLPGAVTVGSGGTLGGAGTVGSTAIASGGTLSPGAAGGGIGTFTVNGNLTFAPNSTYVVDVSSTAADRTNVSGTANLAGTVSAVFGPGSFTSNSYTILSASARNGTFDALSTTGLPSFLRAELQYSATDALLVTLTSQIVPPPTPDPQPQPNRPILALTPNERAVGGTLDSIFNRGGGLFPGFERLQDAQIPAALDALSGEIHASQVNSAVEGSRLVRDAVMGRLWQALGGMGPAPIVFGAPAADLGARSPRPEPIPARIVEPRAFGVWGQAFGTWGSTRGDRNAVRLERDTGGFILGADATLDGTTRVGVAAGFQRATFEAPARLSSGSTDSVFAAIYGGTALGPLNLRLGASFAGQRTDTRRAIVFPGFNDLARAAYDGYTAQAFGELGYRFRLFANSIVEPFVGATALTVHRDRFAEAGGAAALVGFARDTEVGYTTVGFRTEWQPFDAPIVIRGMTGWRHAFGDLRPDALLAFRSSVATPFSISGVPLARDVLVNETAVDWRVSDAVTLTAAYAGQLASRASDHGVKGQVLVKF